MPAITERDKCAALEWFSPQGLPGNRGCKLDVPRFPRSNQPQFVGEGMFGFGRKKIPMATAVTIFLEQAAKEVKNKLPDLREAIGAAGATSASVDDGQLYVEMLPAALAIGLQPVRNIWNEEAFERARRETVRLIEGFDQPEMSYHLKLRLDEHLAEWRNSDPLKGGNLPWDNVSGRVLANLGLARTKMMGEEIISPIAILGVSTVLTAVVGMFWKNVEKNYKLT